MANMDLHDVQKLAFPHNTRLALKKLEVCLQSGHTPQMALQQQRIVDEFVFGAYTNEKLFNSGKVKGYSIKEMILVRTLSEHLSRCSSEALRNSLLLVLFHPSSLDTPPYANHAPQYHAKNAQPVGTGPPYNRPPPPLMHNHPGGVPNPYIRGSCPPFNNQLNTLNNSNPYGPNTSGPYNSGSVGQFSKSGSANDSKVSHRLNILSSLTSLAVATNNEKVLQAVGTWIQQVCCLSGWAGQVCKRLIAEFLFVGGEETPPTHWKFSDGGFHTNIEESARPLASLSSVCPLFTANLVGCWAQLYARLGVVHGAGDDLSSGICRRPPLPVVRLVVQWMYESPAGLLFTPVTETLQLLSHAPLPAPTTALAPLLRWCVEAPFFLHTPSASKRTLKSESKTIEQCPKKKKIKVDSCSEIEVMEIDDDDNDVSFKYTAKNNAVRDDEEVYTVWKKNNTAKFSVSKLSERELYSYLHLYLLQALHATPNLMHQHHRQVLCCKQVITIVEGLIKLLEPLPVSAATSTWRKGPNTGPAEAISLESKMEAVNRLAQVVLVASNTGCLMGNKAELWNVLRRLPIYNRLVKILLSSPHQ